MAGLSDEEMMAAGSGPKKGLSDEEMLAAGSPQTAKPLAGVEALPDYEKYPILAARGAVRAIPGSTDIHSAVNAGLTYLGVNTPGVQSTGPFSERFSSAREKQEAFDRAAEKAYPKTTYGGELAGALALPLAGPAGAIAGRVEPLVGAGVARSLGLGAVGAGYGAATGATSGGDLGERAKAAGEGALLGGVGGALIPPVVDVAAHGLSKVADFGKMVLGKSVAPATFEEGLRATRSGQGMSPQQVQDALAEGQPVLPIDIGGSALKREARNATHTTGEAKDILHGALQERREGQQGRLHSYASRLIGKDLTDANVVSDIRSAGSRAVTPEYEAAYKAGEGGILTPKLEENMRNPHVQGILNEAVDEVNANRNEAGKAMIENPFFKNKEGKLVLKDGQKPSLELWDAIKKQLNGKVTAARETPTSSGDPNLHRVGSGLLRTMLGELDREVPAYAAARAGAQKYLGEISAYRFGQKFLKAGDAQTINHGVKALKTFTPEELEHAQHSYMMERIQKFINRDQSRDISKTFNSGALRSKDVAILGKDKANQLSAFLARENLMDSSLKALGGSNTVENAIAFAKKVAQHHGGVMLGGIGGGYNSFQNNGLDPLAITKGVVQGAIAGYMTEKAVRIGEKSSIDLAKMLVSDDPALRDEAIRLVSTSPKAMDALRRADIAITSMVPKGRELFPSKKQDNYPALPAPKRAERASGGRTMASKPQTAQSLLAAVKRARKAIQSQTEAILAQPDEHVVRALSAVKDKI